MRTLTSLLTIIIFTAMPAAIQAAEPVDYNRDVKPILSKNCFACHGPDDGHRSAGLRLDRFDAATAMRKKGAAIVAGKPDVSRLIVRSIEHDAETRMPPPETGNTLTPKQIAILKTWIEQGARYDEHWAFVPPKRHAVPPVNDPRIRNAVDSFILQRLKKEALDFSPVADKAILLRRLSLDLRGLPPSIAELDAFEKDTSPNAYEKMVDRYLADPAFGERWARVWLDLARYADSAGYGSDPLRLNMWRYRDWVIDAFNRNIPYDRLTVEQLAGDLLPGATVEQKIATAFHRNTMTNTEGGTDDEEFRTIAVKDRVDTTFQVWMGLTVGCAKCHTHKFDPITQKEYYSLYAIFNQTADRDSPDEFPTMPAPTAELKAKIDEIDRKVAELKTKMDTVPLTADLAKWLATLRSIPQGQPLTLTDGRVNVDLAGITGFRIEGGVKSLSAKLGEEGKPIAGRTVRIELPGNTYLMLAEVQVFRNGTNIATKGTAKQSSTDYAGYAKRAIDGNTNGVYFDANSVTHTRLENNPWWEVRLADAGAIDKIVIWNRTDGGSGTRLKNFTLKILDDAGNPVWQNTVAEPPMPSGEYSPGGALTLNLPDSFGEGTSQVFLLEKPVNLTKALPLKLRGEGLATAKVFALTDPTLDQRLTVPANIRKLIDMPKRTMAQQTEIETYYRTIAPALKAIRDESAALAKSKPAMPTVPVMQELPKANQRKSKLMIKGDFLNLGEEVNARLPAAFPKLPEGILLDRMALANWLVAPENPMTARVAVNRWWSQLFGKGLVDTEEDFGTQGEMPSHPELLDWMATEYIATKWDTKAYLKMLVMSTTYRQSSKVSKEMLERDPKNRFYSRSPRYRLEAEMVRDQALALSGLLSKKLGGPSVYPPQPPNLWQAAFNGERSYPTSKGEDRYRRGLYTIWRRTIPYPSMTTFDAPSRETCNIKRIRTNTPLQAFVTLNDPCFVEAAQALSRRIVAEGGASTSARLKYAIRLVTSRQASEAQLQTLNELFDKERARFAGDAKAAKSLATDPLGPLPAGMAEVDLAAWTVIANVLLNLDSVLSRS